MGIKLAVEKEVQAGTVILILSVIIPVGTSAIILVLFITVKLVAETVPNLTMVAPVKEDPVIVTKVPAGPVAGVNELITATGVHGVTVSNEI